MWDLALEARLDKNTTIYVSPIDEFLYRAYVDQGTLGGIDGYFIMRNTRTDGYDHFDILAKAPSQEAASVLFNLIVRHHSSTV